MKKVYTLTIAIIFSTTVQAQNDFINHFKIWLGNWEMKTSKGITIESWTYQNDSMYIGNSYKIKPSGDSVLQESIELVKKADFIFLISRVVDQNNNQPVPFKLSEFNSNYFVFENKAHDFPQKITYDFSIKDSLIATIEGPLNGVLKRINFNYTKKN